MGNYVRKIGRDCERIVSFVGNVVVSFDKNAVF